MKTSEAPPRTGSSIPFTYSRAATELIQSRRRVDEARKSLELALEIFRTLDESPTHVPIQSLFGVLGQLEVAEAALWEVFT